MNETQQVILDLTRGYVIDQTGLTLSQAESNLLLGKLRNRDFAFLSDLRSELPLYNERERYRTLIQIESFFKKNEDFCDLEVTKAAALSSFMDAERRCRITNRRLEYYFLQHERLAPDLQMYLKSMQRFIRRVLGPFDAFLGDIPHRIKLTSGATSDTSRRESMPHMKLMRHVSCPARVAPYLDALALYWGYPPPKKTITCANRIEVVPKNWKTGRTIACEPSGSLPLQLAFDSYVKSRLVPHGIDLSDQLRNRECARVGSIDGSFATVDLKQASDLCALNTVHLLFPEKWAQYLTDIRSHFGVLPDNSLIKYEKFSSMGNGATFAMETLIFLAACRAVGSPKALVYGDDIAIEPEFVEPLRRVLHFLGFRVNTDKTYATGLFRESCGGQYYNGMDITPFYARGSFDHKPNAVLLINSMAARSIPEGHCWAYLKKLVQEGNLPIGPLSDSDTQAVHIDVPSAYSYKKLKIRKGLLYSKQFSFKFRRRRERKYSDRAFLFLWYLRSGADWTSIDDLVANTLRYGPQVRKATFEKQPTVLLSTTSYSRRWVPWVYPRRRLPDYLYWWSEYLLQA